MKSKIKSIIIFIIIGVVLVLVYLFFFKKAPEQTGLVSSTGESVLPTAGTSTTDQTSTIGQDFLALLLSVKSIKLDDSILSDQAFNSLKDSTIEIVGDGTEGRPNPFAPIGTDVLSTTNISTGTFTTTTNLGTSGTVTPIPTPVVENTNTVLQ